MFTEAACSAGAGQAVRRSAAAWNWRIATPTTIRITTDTYKIGADWAPVQDVRFRASYQRAVRAPNVVELFTAQGFNLFDLPGDPCGADPGRYGGQLRAMRRVSRRGVPARVTAARQRVSTARRVSTTSCRAAITALKPETSDTYTYGVIIQPRFLPHLAMSVDYFDIEIEDTISTFGADNTLNACYFQGDAGSVHAAFIRDAGTVRCGSGNGNVDDLNTNIGSLTTKGCGPEHELHRCRAGRPGRVELQPGRHVPE